MTYEVRHTPEGADDYNLCETYDTRDEAVAALIMTHLRYEQMDPIGSVGIVLTFVDDEPMIVTESHGFYSVAQTPTRKRFVRVVEGGFIHLYGVVDPDNVASPVTVHHSHKNALQHHSDLAGVQCEVVSMSEWLELRRIHNG
jgi:hypothetical protein